MLSSGGEGKMTDRTDLFKFSLLHVQLIELLLTILQLFQQVLIQILQLVILLLLVTRLQRQLQLKPNMILTSFNITQSPV